MAKRTPLYIGCLSLFPVAFAGFVVGFGCPVWIADDDGNSGLWQICVHVFKDCRTFDIDDEPDWMIGVRAVEIFAIVMLAVAGAELAYENCCMDFSQRKSIVRIAPGIMCLLGGMGGLSGIIVFAVKMDDEVSGDDQDYGWAMFLVAAGSGLASLVGVGFCVSGCILEKTNDPDKTPINGYGTPYLPPLPQGGDSYEMTSFTNKAMQDDGGNGGGGRPVAHNYPGHALYNGLGHPSYSHRGLPLEPPTSIPPYGSRGPPGEMKGPQYYSFSGDEGLLMNAQFDLSEGYLPSHHLPSEHPYYAREEGAYARRSDPRVEDPYARRGREEDPYYRGRVLPDAYTPGEEPFSLTAGGPGLYPGVPRAGHSDSFRQLGTQGEGRAARGGEDGGRAYYDSYEDRRENFYRSARY